LAGPEAVETEDELGNGEDDVLVQKEVDEGGDSEVVHSAFDEDQFPEEPEIG
jgi:hypothetical protein